MVSTKKKRVRSPPKKCCHEGCQKGAKWSGVPNKPAMFCTRHGGGYRCPTEGCHKGAYSNMKGKLCTSCRKGKPVKKRHVLATNAEDVDNNTKINETGVRSYVRQGGGYTYFIQQNINGIRYYTSVYDKNLVYRVLEYFQNINKFNFGPNGSLIDKEGKSLEPSHIQTVIDSVC